MTPDAGNRCTAAGTTALVETVRIEGDPALVYCSPLVDSESGRVGFDVLFMDAAPLRNAMDRRDYGDLGPLRFALTDGDGGLLFSDPAPDDPAAQTALGRFAAAGELDDPAYLTRSRALPGTDLRLLALADEQRFFAVIDRQVGRVAAVLAAWGVAVLGFTLLALRRMMRTADRLSSVTRHSRLDGMTGLFNRGHFRERLARELERRRRYDGPLSLLMIDIDDFKRINDTHGHPLGDEVIVCIGETLKVLSRATDVPGRYGGEEFMALLPETDAEGAMQVAERLRAEIASRPVRVDGTAPITITVSIGVATCPAGVDTPELDELIGRADTALYESKRGGRDRVTRYTFGQVRSSDAESGRPAQA
jgi:diguanylate cyclase (GGDEF)-like protein